MTVHIAVASGNQAVLFSDSQGSTPQSESHGWHKQFLGANFAVGMAGGSDVINRLFEHLDSQHGNVNDVDVADVMSTIESFYDSQVRVSYLNTSSVIVVGYNSNGNASVHQYEPGKFMAFGNAQNVGSIGSGSQFVARAASRDEELGVVIHTGNLVQMLVAALHYADAANESLTVDDALAVAILDSGNSYLTGDPSLSVRFAPQPICQFWNQAAIHWIQMQNTIRAINREVVSAQRSFSNLRIGSLDQADTHAIAQANQAVQSTSASLTQQLQAFMDEYNQLKSGTHPSSSIP